MFHEQCLMNCKLVTMSRSKIKIRFSQYSLCKINVFININSLIEDTVHQISKWCFVRVLTHINNHSSIIYAVIPSIINHSMYYRLFTSCTITCYCFRGMYVGSSDTFILQRGQTLVYLILHRLWSDLSGHSERE